MSHVNLRTLCFEATDSLLTDVISNFGNVVVYDDEDEKPVGAERPPCQPEQLPQRQSNFDGQIPFHKPGPSVEPMHHHEQQSARPVMQQSHIEPRAGDSTGSVTWKLYNKSLSHTHITIKDNGYCVQTRSPRNVAIYGKPGYQRGKHKWKIAVTGSPACPDSLSVGICVGCNGRGVAVTYEWGFRYGHTKHIAVELDCNAKTIIISELDSNHAADVIGFNNPHNDEVHPYFYLPPPSKNSYYKITVLSIDGVVIEKDSEQCCIL